jgi:RNA polymerase sigma-70 factor (sigma-E family)
MQRSRRDLPPTELGGPDVEPFEVFYRREYRRMVAISRALTRSGSAAEDLVQEAFVSAHRHWERISAYEDPGGWVRRVLINRSTSWHRKMAAELRAVARVGARGPDTLPELTPAATEVWDEVRRLPRRQAQATVLHYVDQLSVEEIGEVLGVSAGAVKSHLHRARANLSRALEAWREEER